MKTMLSYVFALNLIFGKFYVCIEFSAYTETNITFSDYNRVY